MGRLAPKVGDTCESCNKHKLVKLPSTQNKGLMVLACPYCDGERAISLPKPGS